MSCSCNCKLPKYVVSPSDDQLTNTWSTRGYFPGASCVEPDDCKHITSYNDLKNRPSINDVLLTGNVTAEDLGVQRAMRAITNAEIEEMFTKP